MAKKLTKVALNIYRDVKIEQMERLDQQLSDIINELKKSKVEYNKKLTAMEAIYNKKLDEFILQINNIKLILEKMEE